MALGSQERGSSCPSEIPRACGKGEPPLGLRPPLRVWWCWPLSEQMEGKDPLDFGPMTPPTHQDVEEVLQRRRRVFGCCISQPCPPSFLGTGANFLGFRTCQAHRGGKERRRNQMELGDWPTRMGARRMEAGAGESEKG